MKDALREVLNEELALLAGAEEVLRYSYQRCLEVGKKETYTPEEQERFESLNSRFARLSDILVQKLFRLIDRLDLEDRGTVRDRINRAAKKGLVEDADSFAELRELRNRIAHEYVPSAIHTIFHEVLDACPVVLAVGGRVREYCRRYDGEGEASPPSKEAR